jgi:hypothetical protein
MSKKLLSLPCFQNCKPTLVAKCFPKFIAKHIFELHLWKTCVFNHIKQKLFLNYFSIEVKFTFFNFAKIYKYMMPTLNYLKKYNLNLIFGLKEISSQGRPIRLVFYLQSVTHTYLYI